MRNYFKAISGFVSDTTICQEFVFFDDADPRDAREALIVARESLWPRGTVSVWRPCVTVPDDIQVIGKSPKDQEGEA